MNFLTKKNYLTNIDDGNDGENENSGNIKGSESTSSFRFSKRNILIIVAFIVICVPLGMSWYNHLSKSIIDAEFSSSLPLKFNCLTDSTVEVTGRAKTWNYKTYEIPNKTIVSGHLYTIESIGNAAFSNCKDLIQIQIPQCVKNIGENAFTDCSNLEIIIYNSCKDVKVGNGAFDGCKSVIFSKDGHIVARESDTPLKFKALSKYNAIVIADSSYKDLDSVIIPEKIHIEGGLHTVLSINDEAFQYCRRLKKITIPNTVRIIGDCAFCGSGLTEINLPDSINTIKFRTFMDCRDLKHIKIPNSVKSIDEYAFMNCGLTKVFVPSNTKVIKHNAFLKCDSLEITFDNSKCDVWLEDNKIYGCKSVSYTKECNTSTKNYVFQSSDLAFNIISDNNVEVIGKDKGLHLKEFMIPETVKKYKSLTMTDFVEYKVTQIGQNGFSNHKELKTIIIPDNIVSIKEYAFQGCENLRFINIPSSVKEIGKNAFDGCKNLEVIISNSRDSVKIDVDAFHGCKSVTWLKD